MIKLPPTDISGLPTSPEGYADLHAYLKDKTKPQADRLYVFRRQCQIDFWFFCRYATSARAFVCEQEGCEYQGRHVFDHPFVFERCRVLQEEPDGYLDLWPRGHHKTTIITIYLTLWNFLHRPKDTVAIITWELSEVGKGFVDRLQSEMEAGEIEVEGKPEPSNLWLAQLWPKIFWRDPAKEAGRVGKTWKRGTLDLKSHGGEENSITVMSLNSIRTGRHFHIIVYDDIVTVIHQNPDACLDCTSKFQATTPLRHTSIQTRIRAAGTRWYSKDTYRHILDNGILKRRIGPERCYYPDGDARQGESIIHPGSWWLDDWRKALTPALFAANMLNEPLDEQSTYRFHPEWLFNRSYRADPEEMAEGANIYAFIDPARPTNSAKGAKTDYLSVVVVAIRADARRYIIDIYRDRRTSSEWADAIFNVDKAWRARGNPIISWWWELRGAAWDLEFWESEMRHRGYRFDMVAFEDKKPKDERIGRLLLPFERGEIVLPTQPIVHTMDGAKLDMVQAFIQNEYLLYRPTHRAYTRINHGARNEDVLDAMAQMYSPEVKRLLEVPTDIPKTKEDWERQRSQAIIHRHQNGGRLVESGSNPWGV